MHQIWSRAVHSAQSCHTLVKATGLRGDKETIQRGKYCNSTLALYVFCAAAEGFCRQLFFGHFIFSEDPHGLWQGKLEWMSQTPTAVLVLLNLRLCTIQCTGFGSCFSHFTSETNDIIPRMKSYKNKEKRI